MFQQRRVRVIKNEGENILCTDESETAGFMKLVESTKINEGEEERVCV
jgi:hypothetical protein